MAEPRGRRGGKSGGGGSGIGMSLISAALGGGGENKDYAPAAAAVKAGTLSSPGPDYDPRAATSARGVLTPSMQASYDMGPFKPLNWLGKATGQPDPYTQFQEHSALSARASAQQLEDLPKELKIKSEAALAASKAAHDAGDTQLASDLLQLRLGQDASEPGVIHKTWGPLEARLTLGNRFETMGIPAAEELATAAKARLPGTVESEQLNQQRGNAANRLATTQDTQGNEALTTPDNAAVVKNMYRSRFMEPSLRADSLFLNNQETLANRPWWGTKEVAPNRIMMSGPSASGVLGETQPGQLGGKNIPKTDPLTGKVTLGTTPTIPPAFVPGVRSSVGGGSFVPSGGLNPSMAPLTMPSGFDYGVRAAAPASPGMPITEAADQGENFVEPDMSNTAPEGSWLDNYRKAQELERQRIRMIPRYSIPLGY